VCDGEFVRPTTSTVARFASVCIVKVTLNSKLWIRTRSIIFFLDHFGVSCRFGALGLVSGRIRVLFIVFLEGI